MNVVSISMPEPLVDRIDGFADEHGYSGRSEVLREGARTLLEEFVAEDVAEREYACTVTVFFEFCASTVQQRLSELRHNNDSTVSSTAHAHAGERYCVELFVLEGSLEEISEFVNAARSVPDVLAVDYSLTALGTHRSNWTAPV